MRLITHDCARLRLITHDCARLHRYEQLLPLFPNSPYVQCQLAHARYNLREFDDAQLGFEALLKRDPYRLDQVDTYSNILYVKESKRSLSALAQACVSIDKCATRDMLRDDF